MSKGKIDKVRLGRLLREGKSQRKCAEIFGVTESAVSRARKDLGIAVAKVTCLEEGARVAQESLDVASQLFRINERALSLLDEVSGEENIVKRLAEGIEEAFHSGEDLAQRREVIRKVVQRVSKDRFFALKEMQEIRGQLRFQIEILQSLYNIREIATFQGEIINLLGDGDPGMRKEFMRRLQEKCALRRAVTL